MKRTRNKISSIKSRVRSETKKTMSSLNSGIEKVENDYELVFKVRKSHI